MSIKTVTHINFRGDARAALDFYASAFGGEQMVLTYEDAGAAQGPGTENQVMWGQVVSPAGFAIMAYDVPPALGWNRGERPFFVSIRGDDSGEITRYWDALCEGGQVMQALAPSGWSPLYGMVTDRFGVTWVLDVAPAHQAVA